MSSALDLSKKESKSELLSEPLSLNKKNNKVSFASIFEGFGVILVAVFLFLPIFWIAITAFKPEQEVYTTSIFFQATLKNIWLIIVPLLLCLLFNIILNLLLIPKFHILGAALTTLSVNIVLFILLLTIFIKSNKEQ